MKLLSRFRASAKAKTIAPLMTGCVTALVFSGSVFAATEAKAPFKADAARGQQLVTQVCGACHTADGTRGAPANPILQGQHAEYLVKQLREFKAGKRKNAVMQGMVATLTDDDMQHLAAFYANKTAKPGFAKNNATVELGERIYRGGIASLKVPACAGCHSPNGAGMPAQYPRLAGQHADYTELQLTGFRTGARGNNAQMAAIAGRLGEREAKAVADYMAGLR